MRKPNNAGPDLVPFRVLLPRDALRIGKNISARTGVDPANALGALLTVALQTVASPEIAKEIIASVRADLGRDE
jgi:hypothetical protein